MAEAYVTFEKAAELEDLSYKGFTSRFMRYQSAFQTKLEQHEGVGRPRLLVAVSSLSPQAQQRYRQEQARITRAAKAAARPAKDAEPAWYLNMNPFKFSKLCEEAGGAKMEQARAWVSQLKPLLEMKGREKAQEIQRIAAEMDVTIQAVNGRLRALEEAQVLADAKDAEPGAETGGSYAFHYLPLSQYRKPREKRIPYKMTEEEREKALEISVRKGFAENRPSISLQYDIFRQELEEEGKPTEVSYQVYLREFKNAEIRDREVYPARYLAQNGSRKFNSEMVPKIICDTTQFKVMEEIQADAHTLDFWVWDYDAQGKAYAFKPVVEMFLDVKTRVPAGYVFCEHTNARVTMEAIRKMIHTHGVPKNIVMDNGKEITAQIITGQDRKERQMLYDVLDSEKAKGFLQKVGISYRRVKPYSPWLKAQVERSFGTICKRFSARFTSYTGTLTGSRTDGKIPKDIKGMLERSELIWAGSLPKLFDQWLNRDYLLKDHGGLKRAGEPWTKPLELFQNAPRYNDVAAPVPGLTAQWCMTCEVVTVWKDGIRRFNERYEFDEMREYIGKRVEIYYYPEDVSALVVIDPETKEEIGRATPRRPIGFYTEQSRADVAEVMEKRNAGKRSTREKLGEARGAGRKARKIYGALEPGEEQKPDVVALPQDERWRKSALRKAKDKQEPTLDWKANGKPSEAFLARGMEINNRMAK